MARAKHPPKILRNSKSPPRLRQGGKSNGKGPQKGPIRKEWAKLAAGLVKSSPLADKAVASELAADWAVLGKAIEDTQRRMDAGEATGDEVRALPAMVSGRRRLLAELKVLEPKVRNPLDADDDDTESDEGVIR